jgi:hypothetical protein
MERGARGFVNKIKSLSIFYYIYPDGKTLARLVLARLPAVFEGVFFTPSFKY